MCPCLHFHFPHFTSDSCPLPRLLVFPLSLSKMDKPALFYYQIYLIALFASFHCVQGLGKIIFAVNAGGDSHVDIYGVKYQKGLKTLYLHTTESSSIATSSE